MRLNSALVLMAVAVIFMLIAVIQGSRGEGVAVWIALGAVFIALGSARASKRQGGGDEPR
jgi:hypothetical protein